MDYATARDLPTYGQGVRFFCLLPGFDPDEELTYRTLAACLRMDDATDTDGYSDAELWTDLIVPMIVGGQVQHAVWGRVTGWTQAELDAGALSA